MRKGKKNFFLVLISFFLLLCVFGAQVNASVAASSDVILVEEDYSTAMETTDAAGSGSIEVDQTVAMSFQGNLTGTSQGGQQQMLQFSSGSNSASFSRHLMCRSFDPSWNPIYPTTIFRPTDIKAVCLTTVSINDTIEFRWYYRSNSSDTWVSCLNQSRDAQSPGEYHYQCSFLIAGYWPGYHYPRAYKVDVHLDGSPSPAFSEFFEVTNGGLNSPRMCENVENGDPVNMKSRFRIGNDTKAHHYLRFDKIAYFNEELNCCHNFTTVWIQNGSTYKTYSGNFTDYKNTDVTRNYWEYNCTLDDYIFTDSSTLGNWTVEVYLDCYYFNNTWKPYGPVATTPFIVGNETVKDWTFMVYLDGDVDMVGTENASIEIFLKMASVETSSKVNIVVQMDRIPGHDSRYGGWTDCKRFYVTEGMTPTVTNSLPWGKEVNMGDPDTLKEFVNWTINNYPANYYCLVLWDHGAGYMGLCFDFYDKTGRLSFPDFLSLPELSQALSGLPATMDVLLLDACAMSMTEVAYQIKDCVNVLVAPEGIGWAPAPYEEYLSRLTSNSSMLPSAFAGEVVTDYIDWCNSDARIQNATMSATGLTKITSLKAAIDEFALKLKEKETPYLSQLLASHEQIILARNVTEGYLGPFEGDTGYYIDLYHFAQLINQSDIDEELRNTAHQVMTALESIIIIEVDKGRPDSHGLSIFFPDEEGKREKYGSQYEETTFAEDSLWYEFVKYHLSGYILAIETPYPDIRVEIVRNSNTTYAYEKIRVFVLPDSYTVNVTTHVYNISGPGSRESFAQWNDNNMSNPRTLFVNRTLTLEAEYETQYYVTIDQSGSDATVTATIDESSHDLPVSFWWTESSSHNVSVPPTVSGGSDTRYKFTQWNDTETNPSRTIPVTGPTIYTAYYKTQYKVTFSQSGVGTNFTGTIVIVDETGYNDTNPVSFWWDKDTTHAFAFQSPLAVAPYAKQYVWNYTSGLSSVQSDSITVSKSGNITGNYKTQYYLKMSGNFGAVTPNSGWHDAGSTVQIRASAPEDVVNGERYVWLRWTGKGDGNYTGTANQVTITINSPITETASWQHEYRLIIDTNFGTTYPIAAEYWYEAGSPVDISATPPSATSGEQYVWLGWTGTGSGSYRGTDNPASITLNGPINETAAWRHEYYLTGTSLYGSPTPPSGWFEAGKSINASVTSPVSGPAATRYVCTGWTGTGSVSASGATTSVTFTINASSSLTWNWKTQYLLTVRTDPTGISPQPNVSPPGPWYDNGTLVNCTAPEIGGRVFDHWGVDGARWDPGVNPITVTMDGPYEATAHYVRPRAWWEVLFGLESLNFIIAFLGLMIPTALLGVAWVRTRRGKAVIKDLLNKIDKVYSRFRRNPQKCEKELCGFRKKILQDLTDEKITQENYDIMDKKIEEYLEELRKQ